MWWFGNKKMVNGNCTVIMDYEIEIKQVLTSLYPVVTPFCLAAQTGSDLLYYAYEV